MIIVDSIVLAARVLQNILTAYAAHFIALALSLNCPLITQDKELLKKFPRTATSMQAFLE